MRITTDNQEEENLTAEQTDVTIPPEDCKRPINAVNVLTLTSM